MKKLLIPAFAFWLSCLFPSCTSTSPNHFLKEADYRNKVEADFGQKKEILNRGNLFDIFNEDMSLEEREAMMFLYAYMTPGDISDYSGEFYLKNVRLALQNRKETSWGAGIPDMIFRHFVLPVRVNNENLDNAREVFRQELMPRVEKLSMYDAVLEVNHWCHEKVIYTPTDIRTSAPMATVKTAYGRCGEESTFLVAALRAVGIPARQVYTPRWAHTDDNHAWVEAWVDGKWYFLGACEPEPVLDLGWFNAPASRGMLMHTKVFGRYEGKEEVMSVNPTYTEINVIDNYAPTAQAKVMVKDEAGNPVPDACVEFKLYNYAEFYTVATKHTDDGGVCGLTAGKGDMLVWASKDGRFGFAKLSFGKQPELTVTLDKKAGDSFTVDIDIVPPAESANLPDVTPEQRAENDRRLAIEDSIRNAYVGKFISEEAARNFARDYKLDRDAVAKILIAARGNYRVIYEFMTRLRSENSRKGGIDLLQQISAKDLRDVRLDVLIDHMQSRVRTSNTGYFRKYVRNPRVSNEMLTPYKTFFGKVISKEDVEAYVAEPMKMVAWVAKNIQVNKECNLGAPPVSPEGVWKARLADAHSRDIFFVSMARSMGVPARIDEVTGKVQLITDDGAIDVNFEAAGQASAQRGRLAAKYTPIQSLDNPKYYSHFTISKVTPQGNLQLLSYDEGDTDMGGGVTWSSLLKEGTSLDAGDYILVTGTRLASGGVLAQMTSLNVKAGGRTETKLVMRENKDEVQVIGNFNSESLFTTLEGGNKQSLLQACGRGYFVVGILGVNQEPTNHALRDISALKTDLEKWGRKLVLLFPNQEQVGKYRAADFPGLPDTVIYGIDTEDIVQQIVKNMKLKHKDTLPIFIIADTFNRVVFVSQGYTIGLGEQLMKTVKGL